jgi:hypothetical protein
MDYTNSFPWANSLADFYTQTAIPNAPKHTGRLPLSDRETRLSVPQAALFAPEPSMVPNAIMERIQYRHSDTDLNKRFFSQENIDYLQSQIQMAVRNMVGATIDRQSDPDLLMIMRSYYLQYAQNQVGQTVPELDDLNQRVIGFAANRIAVEVEAYRYYRRDIMDFPEPIANPLDTHIYGTRTGELKSFF